MITYYVVAFILLHAFQVQAISKQNKAVRLGQSRGINLQSEPCLLLERDVLYPFGIDDHPDRISDSWRCRVHGLDAVHAGAKKGDHGIVTIQGFEQVLATNTNIKSGVTTLFVSQAYIENHTLKIPPGAEVAFGEITGTSHKRELVVTKDVTKKILAVRVTAKDSETTSDKHEISDKIFGTYGDNVNLKSQMEGCSHGRFMVEKASDGGKNIIEGVVEIQVKLNAIGTLDETLEEETENELETLFGTDNLPSLFDHVMICLPPGTVNDRGESGWVGYGYYNDYISVYNDDWCNYPSIQMHEISHNLDIAHAGEGTDKYGDKTGVMGSSYNKDEGNLKAKMCYNPANNWQLGWYDADSELIDPLTLAWSGKLVGVGNYDPDGSQSGTVILKLKGGLEDYYIGFNHAVGFNFGTPEARNKVTVVTQGDAGSQTWKQAELDAGDTFILANYLGTGQKVTIKVVELITGNNGYAHVQLYKDKECEGGCCFDSDCVHACATGVCQAGSCVFDSSTCQGGLFPPTDTPTQFPAPSLIFAQSGSMPYYFLGECESDCSDDEDCDFGLVCYTRSPGQHDVPGCTGNADLIGDGNANFCITPPTLDTLVMMGDGSESRSSSAFPLQECQGDCDSDSECDDGLACFQRSGNEAIPGCVGGSYGSDYCYRLPTDASAQNPSPSEKTLALIQNSGISRYSLGECEGDCEQDYDCNFGLVCHERKKPGQGVPGCSGHANLFGDGNKNFCVKPVKANTLVLMRDNNEPNLLSTFPLQECQGDCDSDSDCDEGLACFQRNKKMKIPGCSGRGTKGLDYCSRPTADEKRISGTPSYALGKCQDDCDQDHDCNFGLVCFKKKKATQNVPGCSGNAGFRDVVGKGFCVEPAKANMLVLVGDNDQPSSLSAFPLQECQGDCDSDSDCHEGLACFQRNGRKKVPGCKGRGGFGWDYCFRPEPDANIFLRKP